MYVPIVSDLFFPYKKFLIGFSGGIDSTVLLHRFMLLRNQDPNIQIRAIHINHGLSSQSDFWMEHCTELCYEWNIPLKITRVTVIKEKTGIAAQARKARYKKFKESLFLNEALVTAHNLDDQCETFLLALKRGSGPTGLSSMSFRIMFANTILFRPLLKESRSSLLNWARKHSLRWIEDESNQCDCYDRNFLRIHIFPLLNNRWPHILSSISRSANLCKEQENLIDELLSSELSELISPKGAINIAPLSQMSTYRRYAILRRWFLNQKAMMPSYLIIQRIWKEVAMARKDAVPCIHLHGYDIRRFKGQLWRVKPYKSYKDVVLVWYNYELPLFLSKNIGQVVLKSGGNILPPDARDKVNIRFQAHGLIHIVGRHRGRKLKKIWQELNVPPWERSTIPLLFYGDKLIAAAGKFITHEGWVKHGMFFEKQLV